MLAMDAANGNLLWQAEAEPRGYYDKPAAYGLDGVVFVNSVSDKTSALCTMSQFSAQIRLDAATGSTGNV